MFITVRDINIHVAIDGPPGAMPLVLLHSLGTNGHVWDKQIVELARSFLVIRPDMRRHGLTSCTPGPYSMAQLADDLAGLLDALGIQKAHIGGISVGGMIAQALQAAIPGAALVMIEGAAHIPTVEKPVEVTAAILDFLTPAITDYYEAGMVVRKQVLGEAHVARASQNITDFDRDFQAFITRNAWGSIWTRPGLDRRTRSLLTIAMMASLGHEEELKLHLRASKNTGATLADIAEVLMQVAVYAGVPEGNSAFRLAKEIFKEIYP